jgi:hypothetical protein
MSCTKEMDIIERDISISDPVTGKLKTITGMVIDTGRQPIPAASIKAVFDDFVFETISDLNGSYSISIPESKQKGAILAAKDNFLSSIVTIFSESDSSLVHIIARSEGISASSELNSFSINDLFTATGRVVDQTGNPLPGEVIFGYGFGVSTPNGFAELGSTISNEEGIYIITGKRSNHENLGVLSYVTNGSCRNFFGQPFTVSFDPLIFVPDLVIDLSLTESSIKFNIHADGCKDDLIYYSFAIEPLITNFAGNADGQDLTLPYCNKGGLQYFYAGAYSFNDAKNFDGGFYPINAPLQNYNISPCRPSGHFLEVQLGNESISSTLLFDSDVNKYRTLESDPFSLVMEVSSRFSSFAQTDGFGNIISFGRMENINISWQGKTYSSATEFQFYFLSFKASSNRAGVVQSILKDQNGNFVPFKALFKVL